MRCRQKGSFTHFFYFICCNDVISISSGILFSSVCICVCVCVCLYASVHVCGSLFVFTCTSCLSCALCTVCVRMCVSVYMYFLWDDYSYCRDWEILLPSIEPQETELIEIFIGCSDTNVQIRCSCIIKQTLRNSKIQ